VSMADHNRTRKARR
jgi:predicted negative regulator of RcsB-dependent stress response